MPTFLISPSRLVFVADYVDRSTSDCCDRTLDLMMFDLDPDVAKTFVKNESVYPTAADVSRASGISTLLPGSIIQDYVFDPCGYSMNGLLFDAYWTIHITPESHCSYASFETNLRLVNYAPLVKAVLAIFRPKRFTMTLFADEEGLKQIKGGTMTTFPLLIAVPGPTSGTHPLDLKLLDDGNCVASDELKVGGAGAATTAAVAAAESAVASGMPQLTTSSYVQTHKSMSEFMGYSCFMGNYYLVAVGADEESVAKAATEKLSMPRAKYILPHAQLSERVSNLRSRVRKESI